MAIIKNKRTKLKVAQSVEPIDLSDVASNTDLQAIGGDLVTLRDRVTTVEGALTTINDTVNTLNTSAVRYASIVNIAAGENTTITLLPQRVYLLIVSTTTAIKGVAITTRISGVDDSSYVMLYDDESLSYALASNVLTITNNLEEAVYLRQLRIG